MQGFWKTRFGWVEVRVDSCTHFQYNIHCVIVSFNEFGVCVVCTNSTRRVNIIYRRWKCWISISSLSSISVNNRRLDIYYNDATKVCDQYLLVYRNSCRARCKKWRSRRPSSMWPKEMDIVDEQNLECLQTMSYLVFSVKFWYSSELYVLTRTVSLTSKNRSSTRYYNCNRMMSYWLHVVFISIVPWDELKIKEINKYL